MKILTWLPIISPTLNPIITETAEGAISYNPQLVIKQLSYDRSTAIVMGKKGSSNILTTETQLIGEGKDHIISKVEPVFG